MIAYSDGDEGVDPEAADKKVAKLIFLKLINYYYFFFQAFILNHHCNRLFYSFPSHLQLCPPLLTGAYVHDMVEGVPALHDIHHQLGEAQVVLGEQGVDGHRLDHVVHQEESLGVLEAALCEVPPGAPLLQCATLKIEEGRMALRRIVGSGSNKTLQQHLF